MIYYLEIYLKYSAKQEKFLLRIQQRQQNTSHNQQHQ